MRIFLVDDHTLFRDGLVGLLERRSDIEVVGTASSGKEALENIPDARPDVVLLDLKMPDMDGLSALKELSRTETDVRVIVLTVSDDEENLMASLRHGATGYLLKDADPEELNHALDHVLIGETVVTSRMTGSLVSALRDGETKTTTQHPRNDLTPREMEVLRHITLGKSNKAIARELDISPDTVKLHVKNLLHKLDVTSRVSAAMVASRNGLFDDSMD